jgi:hypothetical protein
MDKPKKRRGRRPKSAEDRLEMRGVRMNAAQWAKVTQYGHAWLREIVERAEPPASDVRDHTGSADSTKER